MWSHALRLSGPRSLEYSRRAGRPHGEQECAYYQWEPALLQCKDLLIVPVACSTLPTATSRYWLTITHTHIHTDRFVIFCTFYDNL